MGIAILTLMDTKTITPTGIAVALAVIIALGFLFLGSGFLGLFSSQPAISDTVLTTNENGMADLMMTDTTVGTGAEAVPGATITVNYVGMFEDGQVFDASSIHGQPFTFVLGGGQVIQGWDQGIVGMKVGGTRRLVIPSDLAYGPNGRGPIPGGATLVFDVELLDVQVSAAQ